MDTDLNIIDVFPWNSNFETGISIVDQQHKGLVELLNKLASTLADNDRKQILLVFDDLANYARHHFETEEKVWGEVFGEDDDWFKEHRKTHDSFIPSVLEMKERDLQRPLHEAVEDIVKFLIRWLAFHIVDEDRRMALTLEAYHEGVSLDEAKQKAEQKMADSVDILADALLSMYDNLSSRTLDLMRERVQRQKMEFQLRKLNQKLEKLSITDPLTGLFNRRHFDELLEHELRRCSRAGVNLSLMLLDIDYFKKLNDHYGHIIGDKALKAVANCLKGLCRRPGDYCFRIGGEEFCVVIEDAETALAQEFAERIRATIEALQIPHEASLIASCLTVSVGLVSKVPKTGEDVDTFLKLADDSLYLAKEQGRNRVVGG